MARQLGLAALCLALLWGLVVTSVRAATPTAGTPHPPITNGSSPSTIREAAHAAPTPTVTTMTVSIG